MMGIDRGKKKDLFERDEGRERGHSMKLFKKGFGWMLQVQLRLQSV